jgi:putative ABC transport system permease protein
VIRIAAVREALRRLAGTLRREHADQDLEEELRIHLEMLTEEAERQGHSREDARRLARLRAGGAAQAMEQLRDQRGWPWLDDAIRDAQLALRMMRRGPLLSIVAVASLALGIGANTAIFSLVNTILLRPLPVHNPEELVEVLSQYPGEPRVNSFQWKVYEHVRDQNHVFTDLIAMSPARFQISGPGFDAAPVSGEFVVGRYFDALGVRPAIGRLLRSDDDRAGAAAVAVVSWSFWQSRFNRDPAVVGRQIDINGTPAVVVGVTPREFFGVNVASRPAVWLAATTEPLIQRPTQLATGNLPVAILGRLAPGISVEQARAEMRNLDRWRIDLLTKTAPYLRDMTIDVESAVTGVAMLRDQFAKPLLVLSAIVALMLLIACANVAGLLLARGAARRREMALRLSLGAARWRLVRQLLTESMVLAAIGGILGVLLAHVGVQTLTSIVKSGRTIVGLVEPISVEAHLDIRVLGFTAGLSLLSGLVFGLAPTWHAFRAPPARSLRESGSVGESRSRRLFARSLIVVQVAVSLVLLSAASLFMNHLASLRDDGLGFDRRSVLLVTLDLAKSGYELPQLFQPYQDLLVRLHALPGVRSATLSGVTPIHGAGAARLVRVDGIEESPEARQFTSVNWVAPRYFETFGTPLVTGRDFSFDDRGRAPVAIVNQALERHYFGGASAIGRRLSLDGISRSFSIVGVVGDAKYLDLRKAAPRTVYLNAFQESRMFSNRVSIRTDVPPLAVANDVQQTIADAFTRATVANVTTLTDQVNASIVPERLVATLSGAFATLGAVLVGIGLYGLLAYSVARRTNEIGVRVALGATRSDITRMILASAAWLVVAGLAAGTAITLWSRTLAASVLPQLHVESAASIAVAAMGIVTVALLSSWLPALRASRVEPAQALRCD